MEPIQKPELCSVDALQRRRDLADHNHHVDATRVSSILPCQFLVFT